jgi:hypothetical protein
MENCLTPFASNLFRAMHSAFCTSSENGDSSASVSKRGRHGTTEATGTANDHRYLIVELE